VSDSALSASGAASADPALGVALLRALDNLPVGVAVDLFVEETPRRLYVNPALAAMVGLSVEALRTAPPEGLLAPGERERVAALYRAWLDGASAPSGLDTVLVDAGGEPVPVRLRLATAALDGRPLTVAFVIDLREHRKVEEALRTSEALFRQVAEGAPDGIAISQDGHVVYVNPAAARVFGYDRPSEMAGRPINDFLGPDEIQAMAERSGRAHGGEPLGPREYRGRRRDGSTALMEVSSMPIEIGGRPAMLTIGREVGDRRRRQAELVRAERMAAVGILAAGVAHEINNPLTYVLLQLERLRAVVVRAVPDAALRAQILGLVADAVDGSERVAAIVRDLLWFSRGEAEAKGPVAVADIAETAIKLATSAVRDRAEVVRRFGPTPPAMIAGPRLAQVLVNLLVNAAQAFEREGPVGNRIEVVLAEADGRVVIEVIDNGPGFVDSFLADVFEPFFTTKAGGTGLGLAISRSIVEEAGGTIAAGNRPDRAGALVRVVLPPWRGDVVAPAPVVAAPSSARARVAIIDDEPPIARALGEWLGEEHDVAVFTAADEALAALVSRPAYDVVICDLRMPGLNGLELMRRLVMTRPEYRGRVILVGGAVAPDQAAEAAVLGAEVLHKPFDMTQVDRAVARRLRGRAAAPAAPTG